MGTELWWSFPDAWGMYMNRISKNNVLIYNAMEESGIDGYNADKYLEDGIHLTTEGRIQYADYLIRIIKGDFYPQE